MPERNQNESAIVKGLADEYTDSTPLNQLEFIVKNMTTADNMAMARRKRSCFLRSMMIPSD